MLKKFGITINHFLPLDISEKLNSMNINYIYKIESDKSFKYTGSKIELKEFEDDLVFYTPLNSYKADFALIDNTMNYDTKPEFFTGGKFGSYIKLKDYVKFDGRNIQSLVSQ